MSQDNLKSTVRLRTRKENHTQESQVKISKKKYIIVDVNISTGRLSQKLDPTEKKRVSELKD
jgi:hypothetical protein